MATIDFYAVLELSPTATEEDVRRAYRRLAVRWHPDKNPEDVITAERRFKEVSEAYEVLRDPSKRRQYDRLREGPARPRRTTSWFDSTDGFGDDLWSEPEWGGSRPSWAFRNPFDVFREFFGQRDPWADMTPRSQRQQASSSRGPSSSFWSMGGDPFPSRQFSSPFFSNRSVSSLFNQLLDQRRSASPDRVAPASPAPSTTRVEIKIGGFSDSEDSSSDDEEVLQEQRGGEVVEEDEEEEVEEVEPIDVDDVALREAIRLSLAQEQERKKHEEQEAAQTEEELQEAIRRSLADLEKQHTVPTSGDWMDEEDDEDDERLQRRRRPQQQQHCRQGLSAFH